MVGASEVPISYDCADLAPSFPLQIELWGHGLHWHIDSTPKKGAILDCMVQYMLIFRTRNVLYLHNELECNKEVKWMKVYLFTESCQLLAKQLK